MTRFPKDENGKHKTKNWTKRQEMRATINQELNAAMGDASEWRKEA